MSLETKLRENAEIGAELVKKALKGEAAITDKVKIASLSITQCIKHQATKGATDALKFAVARTLASDKTEMKEYIENNLPDYIHTEPRKLTDEG